MAEVVHVLGREELQDVFLFPEQTVWRELACRWHVSVPRAQPVQYLGIARFGSEAGILQVAQ